MTSVHEPSTSRRTDIFSDSMRSGQETTVDPPQLVVPSPSGPYEQFTFPSWLPNVPSSLPPSNPFMLEKPTAHSLSTQKSFVPLVVLKAEMREKLIRYQRRSAWLPGLIDRLVLTYPFPFEGESTTCAESQNPPYPTTDLILRSKQYKNPIDSLIPVYHIHSDKSCPEIIVKASDITMANYRRNEAMSLALIRELTTIPVPKVLQVSQAEDGLNLSWSVFLAMEYIHGQTLDKCWHTLGFFKKARIIWTLRNYVAQLRRLRRSTPGPLDKSQLSEGYYFSHQGAGPFKSYEDMIRWFNRRIEIGNARAAQVPGEQKCDVSPFIASGPLVFCHQDLSLRNMLLGDDGVLYILDWEWAGFYPEWLEFSGMTKYLDQPWSFRMFIPFICGSRHVQNMKRLAAAGWAIHVGYLLQ